MPCCEYHASLRSPDIQESPELFPEERAALDVAIAREARVLSDLQTRRNALTRICRLPPEILSYIFLLHRSRYSFLGGLVHWSKATHTCRHFRSVALRCPALWSEISFSSPGWTAEMLARSKSAALTLNIGCPFDSYHHNSMKLALAQMHRVKHLEITEATTCALNSLLGNLEMAAPTLQSIKISSPSISPHLVAYQIHDSGFALHDPFILPDKFLSGGAPRLSSLELFNCSLPWNSSLFTHSMTTFTVNISLPSSYKGPRPSSSELLDCLSRMPALKELDLSGILPTVPNSLQESKLPDRVISLPRLDKLVIKGSSIECSNVFSCLTIPRTAKVQLWALLRSAPVLETNALMHALAKARGSPIQPRTMHIRRLQAQPMSVLIEGWERCYEPSFEPLLGLVNRADYEIDLVSSMQIVDGIDHPPTLDQVLDSVRAGVDTSKLVEFSLHCVEGFTRDIWLKYFGNLERLQRIELVTDGAETLIEAMEPSVQVGSEKHIKSNLPFRSLEELQLEAVDLVVLTDSEYRAQDTLALRAEYGAALQKLIIANVLAVELLGLLQLNDMVPVLIWDGSIGAPATEDEDEF